MTDPLASAINLGWGGEPFAKICLRALQSQTYLAIETTVVDNHSPDRTAGIVECAHAEVQLICTGQNLDVPGCKNVGSWAAQGHICALVNADIEPHPLSAQMIRYMMEWSRDVVPNVRELTTFDKQLAALDVRSSGRARSKAEGN